MKSTLKNLTTAELRDMQDAIENELTIRKNQEKEQVWNEVCDAIQKYCRQFGDIDIIDEYADETTMYLDEHWDFSTIGEIRA